MEENQAIPTLKPKLSRRETARKRRTEHEIERKVVQNRCTEFLTRSTESPSISPVSLMEKQPLGKGQSAGSIPAPGTIHPLKTTTRGALSEAEVMLVLARLGASVWTPAIGHDHSFDLIAHWDGHLSRVQVKTMRVDENGSLAMSGQSTIDRKGGKQYPVITTRECDVIVGWSPTLAKVYAVKPDGRTRYCFRIQPARNGQTIGIRLASDYELTRLEQLLPDYPRL